jgi:hypothetical protein
MAGQFLSRYAGDSGSVAGGIPAPQAAHIVKVANSARAAPAGPFLPKAPAAAVRVMSRLPLPR